MSAFSLDFAINNFPEILKAVPTTLLIAVVSMFLGLVLGLVIVFCRVYRIPFISKFCALYVSFIRGTPMLVQIYVIFYGIPMLLNLLDKKFGLNLSSIKIAPLAYALIAFTINTSAYQSETIRSAVNSVNSGQMEAAYSVGMNTFQGLRRIIIPQAFIVALPNFGNIFIGLIHATSLAFAVQVVDIMAAAKIVGGDGYRYLEMYLDAALVYWIICFSLERAFAFMEKRISKYVKILQ